MPFEKILIAVNSSSVSLKAVQTGFALAKQLNASAGLVFVIDKTKELGNADLGILPIHEGRRLRKEAEDTIAQMISMYGSGMEVLKFVPEGSAREEILIVSREWGAGLIVIGTHSRTGLAHLLQGGTTEYIVHHATKPVMVVSPQML